MERHKTTADLLDQVVMETGLLGALSQPRALRMGTHACSQLPARGSPRRLLPDLQRTHAQLLQEWSVSKAYY